MENSTNFVAKFDEIKLIDALKQLRVNKKHLVITTRKSHRVEIYLF